MSAVAADSEYTIVGGGVVGLSIAYGLVNRGKAVTMYDEGDVAFRASRGNFGLVWVQGKGAGMPAYARWTRSSARLWQGLTESLKETTGVDVSLVQNGGYSIFLDEASLEKRVSVYEKLRVALNGDYPFEVLGHNAIKKEEPQIGPDVVGAILHHEDGHLNPLQFYRALTAANKIHGVTTVRSRVTSIQPVATGFKIHSESASHQHCEKLVLACGLGTAALGKPLGFKVPIRPQRGQVLITEKIPHVLNRPSDEIRQVNEGAIQIGASAEEVGFDDSETIQTTAMLAANAIKQYPILGRTQLIRSWGALRIMSPDGFPIYQQSKEFPGAYFATCHSGITLAAAHANLLPAWLCGERDQFKEADVNINEFSEDRFSD